MASSAKSWTVQLSLAAVVNVLCLTSLLFSQQMVQTRRRPNILLAISDDQSWPHSGAYGCEQVRTPAFDRIAENGVLFSNAFCAASQCSVSRATLLTGRNPWQLKEAGTQGSLFPAELAVYTELLAAEGYHDQQYRLRGQLCRLSQGPS